MQRVIETTPQNEQVTVRFVTFDDPQSEKQNLIVNDRSWFPAERCHRDDQVGVWPCKELAASPPREAQPPQGGTTFPRQAERHVQEISSSLVLVNFAMPYTVSGVADRYYYGTGLIADAQRGWVVVDRNTVPVAMGDVRLTFAGSLEIPGRVEYIHPLHNLAVVSYDPTLIGTTPVKSATFAPQELLPGQDVAVVGLGPDFKLMSLSSKIATIAAASFPLSRTLRFRDTNLEAVSLVNGPMDFDGTLVDVQGRVLGMWASFAYQTGRDLTQLNMGIPADLMVDMIEHLRAQEKLRSIEVEWQLLPLATARKLNLPEEWVRRYEAHNADRREVLAVTSTVAGIARRSVLSHGRRSPVRGRQRREHVPRDRARDSEADRRGRSVPGRPAAHGDCRDRGARRPRYRSRGAWGGALLQAPHRELAAQRGIGSEGVYVSFFNFGSPASRSGLFAGRRIVAVDGKPTPDLSGFIDVVGSSSDRSPCGSNTVTWNDVPEVITMKLDPEYWPSYELRREGYDWRRYALN